jgi:hypothetical protein
MEAARGIFGNISKIRGLLGIFVDYGLILDKNRGLFAKWHEIICFKLFSNGKRCGLGPRAVLVHGGPQTGPRRWLAGAWSSGCSGPRWLAARVAMRRGRGGATRESLTGAWMMVRRQRDGGGASAQKGVLGQ